MIQFSQKKNKIFPQRIFIKSGTAISNPMRKILQKSKLLPLWIGLWISALFIGSFLYADQCPTYLNEPDEVKKYGNLRIQTLRGWDKILTWALSPKDRSYPLKIPLEQKRFEVHSEEFFNFDKNYGYFSIYHPIVGMVTDAIRDIDVTKCI